MGRRNCHLCHFRKVEFHRLANNYVDALITQRKRRPSPKPKIFRHHLQVITNDVKYSMMAAFFVKSRKLNRPKTLLYEELLDPKSVKLVREWRTVTCKCLAFWHTRKMGTQSYFSSVHVQVTSSKSFNSMNIEEKLPLQNHDEQLAELLELQGNEQWD